ncbi:MAG: hypothetical protein ACR2MP_02190 [Streptosporangiaceae bacterium]
MGASRDLGRGIARAGPALAAASPNIRAEVADAAGATVAWSLLDQGSREDPAGY